MAWTPATLEAAIDTGYVSDYRALDMLADEMGEFLGTRTLFEVRSQMESLPISRGYFEAINLHRGYIRELREQTDLLAQNPAAVIPMDTPAVPFAQFPFSEDRIRMLLKINAVTTMAQARALVPSLKKMEKDGDMSEDEHRLWADEVQEMTDKHIKLVDERLVPKDAEILQV